MASSEPWTVGRLLQWTTDYLKKHAAEAPRLDAEVLLAHALGCERIELYTQFDALPGEARLTAFRELVKRRAAGAPVAYLVGHREFFSLPFRVTPEVLIPRPETELIVVTLMDLARASSVAAPAIADVGTGSGILAICAAKHLPMSRVTAIDNSPAALAVARENAAALGVAERIAFVESDLFSAVPGGAFDFIVSNPPYVSETEYLALDREVREYEPRAALVAGPAGTEVIAALVPQAAERLSTGGHLLLEVSPMIERATVEVVSHDGRFETQPTIRDLARRPRVINARRK